MIRSEGVSGILFHAELEKQDDSNSPLLRNFISSQNTVREEMKFCYVQSFRDTYYTHFQISVSPFFRNCTQKCRIPGERGLIGKLLNIAETPT
jgi:hypothetical protein